MTSAVGSRVPTTVDLRLLVPALAAWAADVVLLWVGTPPWVPAAMATLAMIAAGASAYAVGHGPRLDRGSRRRDVVVGAALTCAAVSLVTTCLAGHEAIRSVGYLDELVAAHATVTLEASVESDPRPVAAKPGRRVDERVVTTRLRVTEATGRGLATVVSAPVLAIGDDSWLAVAYGERIRVTGRLVAAEPGDDVVALLRVNRTPEVLEEAPLVVRAAAYLRGQFQRATAGLPADPAGLVPALVIGDTSATPEDLTAAMKATGMSHLSAVSGSNISLILAAGLGLCRWLGIGRRWRPVAALIMLAGFVVITRPEPSVIRAAVMGVVGLVGLSVARQRMAMPALSAAVIILLSWDPWLARSYGFALSVLATLGLVLFASSWGEWITRRLPWWMAPLGPALAVPLAAQVMVAPVVVLLQGSVQLIAIPANLLAGPLVGPATIGGVVTALVAAVWMPLAQVCAWAPALPAWGIALIARTAAGMPGGAFAWPGGAWGALGLAVVCAAVVAVWPWLGYQIRERPSVACVVIGCVVAGLVPIAGVTWVGPGWRFIACNVGQGDGLVLASAPGHAVLVDVGPDPMAIRGCLDRLGVHTLDAIVLTHFHADHVDGLAGALEGRSVGEIVACPIRDPPAEVESVLAAAAARGIPVSSAYAGDHYRWGVVESRVWWPARVIREGSVPNNASIVMSVSVTDSAQWSSPPGPGDAAAAGSGVGARAGAGAGAGAVNLVLLGDIEHASARAVLSALRRDPAFASWRVDVVKVAHHGSADRDDDLLDALAAPLAVICVGVGNDYGHPASATLAALAARGFTILRTDRDGDIAVSRGQGGQLEVTIRGP